MLEVTIVDDEVCELPFFQGANNVIPENGIGTVQGVAVESFIECKCFIW